jgi:hypothetical protein
MSTSEGGTSTPSVLATAMMAWRFGAGRPSAASRGETTRESPSTQAATASVRAARRIEGQ